MERLQFARSRFGNFPVNGGLSGDNLKSEPMVSISFSSPSHMEARRKIQLIIIVMIIEGYNNDEEVDFSRRNNP